MSTFHIGYNQCKKIYLHMVAIYINFTTNNI